MDIDFNINELEAMKALVIQELVKTSPRAMKLLSAKTIEEFYQIQNEFLSENEKKKFRFKKHLR